MGISILRGKFLLFDEFNILVLDDEIEIARAIKLILSKYDIHITDKVGELRTYLEKKDVSLLIIDFELHQGISGIELSKEIKQMYPLIQVILFTGNTEYITIKDALNSGAISSFLNKPISKTELMQMVEENKKIWIRNTKKLNEAIERIKMGQISDFDISQFGNQLPILNLLIKVSVKFKKSETPQIIGLNITHQDVILYQEFIKNDLIIHNDLLFLGFIETVHKLGIQMFDKKESSLEEINFNDLNLFNKIIEDNVYTIFVINHRENSRILDYVSSYIDDVDIHLKENRYVISDSTTNYITKRMQYTNQKLLN